MGQWIKIAGLSATLAAGVVTAFGDTGQAATASGKLFRDRLPSPATSRKSALRRARWRSHPALPVTTSSLAIETAWEPGLSRTARPRSGPTSRPHA